MNPKQIGIGLIVLAIIVVAVMQFNKPDTSSTAPANTMEAIQPAEGTAMEAKETSAESSMNTSAYEDGTYEAMGNYTSPAQEESIDVELTIKNGVVTGAAVMGKAVHPTSIKLQGMFVDGFKEEVVGKSVDEISLTAVNGSSLTPQGFMDALEKIKTDATKS